MYRYLRRTMRKILPAIALLALLLTDGFFRQKPIPRPLMVHSSLLFAVPVTPLEKADW